MKAAWPLKRGMKWQSCCPDPALFIHLTGAQQLEKQPPKPERRGTHELIHIDAHCIVAVKPSGLLSVPGRGLSGVASPPVAAFASSDPPCGQVHFGNDPAIDFGDNLTARVQMSHPDALVVHRLDMSTSGLMLLARGAAAQRHLSIAFARREVDKRYVAVVHGHVAGAEGEIHLPLMADWPNRPRQKVDMVLGKPSHTRYRVMEKSQPTPTATPTTRLELEPVTGRSHQLRVHLMSIGHPVLGDALYAPPHVLAAAPRLLLHATQLEFAHPVTGKWMAFKSKLPF
jgi:tRNA pseudouridine32 synthase / 23S rRNA pseudouridine746 synthase